MNKYFYFGGTFDLIHLGHCRLFNRAFRQGLVTVGLNTDKFILEFKGRLPLHSYADRKEFLESLQGVDYVIENEGGADSKPSILASGATHLITGPDWLPRERYMKQLNITEEWLSENGITLEFWDSNYEQHGTDIKRRIVEAAGSNQGSHIPDATGDSRSLDGETSVPSNPFNFDDL